MSACACTGACHRGGGCAAGRLIAVADRIGYLSGPDVHAGLFLGVDVGWFRHETVREWNAALSDVQREQQVEQPTNPEDDGA